MKRGEIRWYAFRLPDKRRPVLILTRNDVIDRLNEIIVVPPLSAIAVFRPQAPTLPANMRHERRLLV